MDRHVANARLACLGVIVAASLACAPPAGADEQDWARQRAQMIATIEDHASTAGDAVGDTGLSPAVLEVMGRIERHLFVPEDFSELAYDDRPVPIGYGQTISQPFIVALMTHLLQPDPGDTALEVGTGSGYQAAVLSPLVEQVCTIEIIPQLGETAAERLDRLGFANVSTRVGDGYFGWPECGPFDRIVVTAAAGHVPPPLVEQLKPGGRMVIPVGGRFVTQYLTLVEKAQSGEVTTRQLLPVLFVPLTR
jgi:protein-L-isoaspartate(D-aspartate) O-methyltransferase